MKKSPVLFVCAMVFALAALPASAQWGQQQSTSYGQKDVPANQARSALPLQSGVVIDVQDAEIEVQASNTVKAASGVAGGLLVAALFQKESWQTQSALGTLAGLGSAALADKFGREMRPASQIIVKLANGSAVAVVQETSDPINVGDQVYVVGGSTTRVVKAKSLASN